jgi:hypothetical protein
MAEGQRFPRLNEINHWAVPAERLHALGILAPIRLVFGRLLGLEIDDIGPTHSPRVVSHDIGRLRSDHGRPCSSAEARLYILRRLAGQAQAQLK